MPSDLTPTPECPGIHIGGPRGAAYACACGRVRAAGGSSGVPALVADWQQHRAECRPTRTRATAPARSGSKTTNHKRTTTIAVDDGGLF